MSLEIDFELALILCIIREKKVLLNEWRTCSTDFVIEEFKSNIKNSLEEISRPVVNKEFTNSIVKIPNLNSKKIGYQQNQVDPEGNLITDTIPPFPIQQEINSFPAVRRRDTLNYEELSQVKSTDELTLEWLSSQKLNIQSKVFHKEILEKIQETFMDSVLSNHPSKTIGDMLEIYISIIKIIISLDTSEDNSSYLDMVIEQISLLELYIEGGVKLLLAPKTNLFSLKHIPEASVFSKIIGRKFHNEFPIYESLSQKFGEQSYQQRCSIYQSICINIMLIKQINDTLIHRSYFFHRSDSGRKNFEEISTSRESLLSFIIVLEDPDLYMLYSTIEWCLKDE